MATVGEDEQAFDAAMMEIYTRARDEVGYNASRYFHMLLDHGGVETARILVNAAKPSDGYTALWERDRLDLTVEALVVEPRWARLFADDSGLVGRARRRLDEYGYRGSGS